MLKEFKEFAVKGNAIDLAVAVIIGAAFGGVVKSLVSDIIMPPIGLLVGNVDFSNLFLVLREGASHGPYLSVAEAGKAGAVTLNYGLFLNTLVDFVIVGFAVFLMVRSINRLKAGPEAEAPPEPTTRECPHCMFAIPIRATRCAYCTSEIK